LYRLSWKAFKGDASKVVGLISDEEKRRVDSMSALELVSEETRLSVATKAKTSSRFLGVSKSQGKFRSQIKAHGLQLYIGYYASEVEAALAYDKKAFELRGRYCPHKRLL
jgi:hypothetical protein